MFNEDLMQTILILVTLILAGWAVWKSYQAGEVIMPSTLVGSIETARPVAVELMEIAQVATNSIEQLRREGKIENNDVALNRAIDLIKKWVPDEWEVSNSDIIAAINAGVLVSSALARQAGASSENR